MLSQAPGPQKVYSCIVGQGPIFLDWVGLCSQLLISRMIPALLMPPPQKAVEFPATAFIVPSSPDQGIDSCMNSVTFIYSS